MRIPTSDETIGIGLEYLEKLREMKYEKGAAINNATFAKATAELENDRMSVEISEFDVNNMNLDPAATYKYFQEHPIEVVSLSEYHPREVSSYSILMNDATRDYYYTSILPGKSSSAEWAMKDGLEQMAVAYKNVSDQIYTEYQKGIWTEEQYNTEIATLEKAYDLWADNRSQHSWITSLLSGLTFGQYEQFNPNDRNVNSLISDELNMYKNAKEYVKAGGNPIGIPNDILENGCRSSLSDFDFFFSDEFRTIFHTIQEKEPDTSWHPSGPPPKSEVSDMALKNIYKDAMKTVEKNSVIGDILRAVINQRLAFGNTFVTDYFAKQTRPTYY